MNSSSSATASAFDRVFKQQWLRDVEYALMHMSALRNVIEKGESRDSVVWTVRDVATSTGDLVRYGNEYFRNRPDELKMISSLISRANKLSEDWQDESITTEEALAIEEELRSDLNALKEK